MEDVFQNFDEKYCIWQSSSYHIYCALLHDSHFMFFINVQYLFNHLNVSKQAVNTKKVFGALLTDLSKALDYLPHDLINSLTQCKWTLNLIQRYFGNREQITKTNCSSPRVHFGTTLV